MPKLPRTKVYVAGTVYPVKKHIQNGNYGI